MTKKKPPGKFVLEKTVESNTAYFYVLPVNAVNELIFAGMDFFTFFGTRALSWVMTNLTIPPAMWGRKKYHKGKSINETTEEKVLRRNDRIYATKIVAVTRPVLITASMLTKNYLVHKGYLDEETVNLLSNEGLKNILIGWAGGTVITYTLGGHIIKVMDQAKELLHLAPAKRLSKAKYDLPYRFRRSIAAGYVAATVGASGVVYMANDGLKLHDKIIEMVGNNNNKAKQEQTYTPSQKTWLLYATRREK